MSRWLWLLTLLAPTAGAEEGPVRLSWSLTLDGKEIGRRDATYTIDRSTAEVRRVIEARTKLDAKVGPVAWAFEQKIVGHGGIGPVAFRSVQVEDGVPFEVQGRWAPTAWTVVRVDRGGTLASEAAPHRIDLSSVDLFDPFCARPLASLSTAKVLLAETGEILEGPVEPLGPSVVKVGGAEVAVQGFAWTAPIGRSTFWYDADGWLVRYQTSVLGHAVEGVLTAPPPAGPDSFTAGMDGGGIQAEDL